MMRGRDLPGVRDFGWLRGIHAVPCTSEASIRFAVHLRTGGYLRLTGHPAMFEQSTLTVRCAPSHRRLHPPQHAMWVNF